MQSAVTTRSARKEETRRRLLEAALDVVAAKGFAGASVAEIAERAGVTTGAVYSNFRSKEALLLELVTWQERQGTPDDPAHYPPPDEPGKPVVRHLVDVAVAAGRYADTPESRRLAVLQIELFLLALRDRTVRSELIAIGQNLVKRFSRVLAEVQDVPHPGPPPSLDELAEIFYACVQGLQQHRLLDPQAAPDEAFEWFVKALLYAASPTAGRRASRPG